MRRASLPLAVLAVAVVASTTLAACEDPPRITPRTRTGSISTTTSMVPPSLSGSAASSRPALSAPAPIPDRPHVVLPKGACSADRWCVDGSIDVPRDLHDVWGASGHDVWAVGDGGTILHFQGVWSRVNSGTTLDLQRVCGSSDDDAWAVGTSDSSKSSALLHWDGTSWAVQNRPAGAAAINAVLAIAKNDLWIAGNDDDMEVAHWDGTTWITYDLPGHVASIVALWASGPSDVWAVDPSGVLAHWDGAIWTPFPTHGEGLTDVWGSGPRDVWAIGSTTAGGESMLRFDGATWSRPSADSDAAWSRVRGTGPKDVWLVGSSQGAPALMHFDGAAWKDSVIDAGDRSHPVRPAAIWGASADDLWLVGADGAILRRQQKK